MRRPVDETSRIWITDPKAAAYLNLANAIYGTMVNVLTQTFSITNPDVQIVLMRVSVELMEASAAVSLALARLPAGRDYPGVDAEVTFAMPRNSAYRLPQARARLHFLERIQQLQAGAEEVLSGEAHEKAMGRLGNAISLIDGSGDFA